MLKLLRPDWAATIEPSGMVRLVVVTARAAGGGRESELEEDELVGKIVEPADR